MNLRASRIRILPAAVVLIALAAFSAITPWRPSPATRPVPKAAAGPMLAAPQPEAVTSQALVPGSPLRKTEVSTPVARSPLRAPPATAPTAAGGMVIGVDPETGALGPPTGAQWAELRSALALARSRRDAVVEMHLPDGAVGIDVGGWLQEFAVVRTGPDGKPIFGCLRPGEASAPDSAASPLEIQ